MTLQLALTVATQAHKGQTRNDGSPYIIHPRRVSEAIKKAGGSEDAQMVAMLHDTIEDTMITEQDLVEYGFSPEVIKAVVAVTKIKGGVYADYLAGVKKNKLALIVKIADMVDNITDAPSQKQKDKYLKGLMFFAGV